MLDTFLKRLRLLSYATTYLTYLFILYIILRVLSVGAGGSSASFKWGVLRVLSGG